MKSDLVPVLVFGPRKSGTTLLHNLLDGGSELLMIPGELKLQRIQRNLDATPPKLVSHYLHRGRLDFERLIEWKEQPQASNEYSFDGLSVEQTREVFDAARYVAQLGEMLSAPPQGNSSTAQMHEIIERDVSAFLQAGKRLPPNLKFWASKEVSSWPETVLKFWRELYPEGRIVYLVRQPEFIVRSILNDRRRKGYRPPLHTIWFYCFEAQHLINFAHAASQWSPAERPIFLSYEEMTTAPEKTLRNVARKLGIAFEEVLATPTTLGVPMVVRTSSRTTNEIFQQPVSWQQDLTPRELKAIRIYRLFEPLIFRRRRETFVPYATMQARLKEMNDEQ